MENENKNANRSNEQKNRKNKQRRHKSYFLTPTDAKAAPASESNQNTAPQGKNNPNNRPKSSTPIQQEKKENKGAPQVNQGQKQEHSSNHRRNKHKHHNDKKANDKKVIPATQSDKLPTTANTDETNFSVGKPVAKKSDKLDKSAVSISNFGDRNKYDDYEEFSYEELYSDKEPLSVMPDSTEVQPEQECEYEPMIDVVGIKFKASGKTYYFSPKGYFLKAGSYAIVETARGLEYGEVALGNTKVKESETVPPLRPVIRPATDADKKRHAENKVKEEEAFRLCNIKIIEHELDMKLIDAQYTFDSSKLLFYFTSSGRVDFRNLVKDLAGVFRTRIELRQIGIRDEAKMVGGLGLCGRPLCCSLFLTDFGQVSIKMAKEQNLSLNSSKISGICGRLMCCLRYEHDTYEYEIKRTPPVDTIVRTADGIGVVTEISPLTGTIKVKLDASPDIPPKSYKRNEVSILRKKK